MLDVASGKVRMLSCFSKPQNVLFLGFDGVEWALCGGWMRAKWSCSAIEGVASAEQFYKEAKVQCAKTGI